ncbi:MAG: alanine--glyoxylate aminotransferase family protein [Aigarchaeota archaeon]|nr:alanine--glyoxylate aminotransferase family protein [Aigarchaeota archaeon]MCX8193283.1 alanine--glyoxylate aminotransferase family protein [Nitrososphaeria archaeon]MDW7986502.1 alanine--glyoxylate aminotransferase family protein [Nitrososphaerota archaeon]
MKILMTPGPVDLDPRVRKALSKQVVSHRSSEFHELVKSIVENAKKIFKTDGDIFILTSSGTLGVECALSNSIDVGEKVLIPVYGVFGERMAEAAEQYGGNVLRIDIEWNKALSPEVLEEELSRSKDVNVVSFVHNETSTGTMVKELEKVSEIVKKYGKFLVVDAVSSLGGVPIYVDKLGIDICVVAAQKCLGGPPGLTLISVSDEAWKKILSKSSKTPSYIDLKKHKKFMEKFETPFTPPVNLMYGLDEALKIIIEEGIENWWQKHSECSQLLYNTLQSLGFRIYSHENYRSITVASAQPEGSMSPKDIVEEMEKNGVTIAEGMGKLKDKIIRVACMANVNKKRIEYFREALKKTLKTLENRSSSS